MKNIKEHLTGAKTNVPPYKVPIPDEYYAPSNVSSPQGRKANAVIVMLGECSDNITQPIKLNGTTARNGDVNGAVSSVKQMEDRFNKKFQYPYVFLNEVAFDDNFKK